MHRNLFSLLAAAAAVSLPTLAEAQVIGGRKLEHFTVAGDQVFQNLGDACAGMGDLNGDSIPDFVSSGASRDSDQGRVTAFSGADGSELWHVDGENTDDHFGFALVNLGDIDDDGVNDLAVSAPFNDELASNGGKVYVLSGVDGSEIRAWASSVVDRERGRALGAADIDHDGYRDVILGMPTADELGFSDNGKISAFNAKTGSFFVSSEVFGSSSEAFFGQSVTGIGDWDGDGHEDVASSGPGISSNGLTNNGRVTVFSGSALAGSPNATPLVIHIFDGLEDFEFMGEAIARAGDQDGDGAPDLLVGSPFWSDSMGNTTVGRASLWSSSGRVLITHFDCPNPHDSAFFGIAVAPAGDTDNDGFRDVLIGARNHRNSSLLNTGAAFAFSGRTLELLQASAGNFRSGRYADSLAGIGDIDGDGTDEYIVGEPFSGSGSTLASGSVHVIGREAFLTQSARKANPGDTVNYQVDFPTAGGFYKILASLVGTGPTTYTGVEVPLDTLYIPITSNAYPAWTSGFFGSLSASGEATASMTLPVALPSVTIYFAAIQSNTGATVDLSSVVQILEVL